jgi:hypothetical protein
MKIASLIFAAVVSVGAAASAHACENFVGAASHGAYNRMSAETYGDHYVSLDQEGYRNALRARVAGDCNAYVAGQYGVHNVGQAKIYGRYNEAGMLQNADNVRARMHIDGDYNDVAIIQSRPGSDASVDTAGVGNTVVIRAHH